MKSKRLAAIIIFLLGVSGVISSIANAYNYPFADPWVSTVIGTPSEFAEVLPMDIPLKKRTITLFPDRKVPGVLWNLDEFSYSYVQQEQSAPLIFLIAGTGSSYNSSKMQMMQRAFYAAGFHVISISSPTHPNFIVSASSTGVPGNLEEDAKDIYQVMKSIWSLHKTSIQATEFHLAGYSLGGAHSAFVAKHDETEKAFNFKKVLMINPPVSLYNSVRILDNLVTKIPGGINNFNTFYQKLITAFSDAYAHGDHIEFNDEFLYETYRYKRPTSDEPLEALIGVSFRISNQNMVFTSDVLTKAGYVVPKGLELGRHSHITPYIKALGRLTFIDYFNGLFLPYFQSKDPSVTVNSMIKAMSLTSIEDYLRNSEKIGLIHNADDIILELGELQTLQGIFGDRATIFPIGGHCGNMAYPDNVRAMTEFFSKI